MRATAAAAALASAHGRRVPVFGPSLGRAAVAALAAALAAQRRAGRTRQRAAPSSHRRTILTRRRRAADARSLVCKWKTQLEAAAAKAACWRSWWWPTTATRRRPTTAAAAAVPCRLDLPWLELARLELRAAPLAVRGRLRGRVVPASRALAAIVAAAHAHLARSLCER